MTPKDFKTLIRVVKELHLYTNYAKDIKNKGISDLRVVSKRNYYLDDVIDSTLWWDHTMMGFNFWSAVNNYFRNNKEKLRKGGQDLFICTEELKKDLSRWT